LWTGGRINADGVLHDKRFREIQAEGIRTNIWPYPTGGGKREHPAPFPLQLAKDHVASWSAPGDVVLDPFMGSGTTAKAAKELERQYIGFEINPEYCNIGEARTAQEVLSFSNV
jgi:DNA modification methylase